jgi:hypothetical protein
MLKNLAAIRENLVVYSRRQGRHHNSTVTCLTCRKRLQQPLFSLLRLERYAPTTA